MPMTITLPDELITRLQKQAVPFVDTPLSVIERALDTLEAGGENLASPSASNLRSFNPAAAPNLSYTTPQLVKIGGKLLPGGKSYWNPMLFAVIEEAIQRGVSSEDICELLTVNYVRGKKEGSGYKYIPSAGISVQGQDANAAWKQTYRLASSFGIPVEVEFLWQNTEKAALPNTAGFFEIDGS